MGIPAKDFPENRNTTNTSAVSTSGSLNMVAVGGARRGSKAKKPVLSRYLRPKVASCHDSCKPSTNDEGPEIKRPTRRMGSRKMSFNKNREVKRTVEPVERKKKTKTKPKRCSEPKIRAVEPVEIIKSQKIVPSKKVGVSRQGSPTYRKVTQKDLQMPKDRPTNVKTNAISSSVIDASSRLNGQKTGKDVKTNKQTRMLPKSTSVDKPVSPVKNQNPEKVEEMTEMTLQEAETAELEFVTPIAEIPQSPTTVTTESTDLLNSENTQSPSDKQVSNSEPEHEHNDDEKVLEEEHENTNDEEVIVDEDDYEMEKSNYRVVNGEDEEDEGLDVKFRRGRVIEPESDDSPRKLNFRRGTILDNDCDHESESVTLKHQEQKEKEAQELLNRLIEEKANKFAEDRKTKVGALVGAFETVISLQDDIPSSES